MVAWQLFWKVGNGFILKVKHCGSGKSIWLFELENVGLVLDHADLCTWRLISGHYENGCDKFLLVRSIGRCKQTSLEHSGVLRTC